MAAGAFTIWGLALSPEFAGLAMAFSSISVVLNSLLLKGFRPGKISVISRIAPVLMTGFFCAAFWQFSQLTPVSAQVRTYVDSSPAIASDIRDYVANARIKTGFDARNFPKIMLDAQNAPAGIRFKQGSGEYSNGGVVLGSAEASMMIREGLIRGVGSEISNFFGITKIRIAGILEPTGTILDDAHIFGATSFDQLALPQNLVVKQTPFGDLKLFYVYDESTIPAQFRNVINPRKTSYAIGAKNYVPAYVGYTEAKMMMEEGLFAKTNDTINGLFENDFVIAGLPKKTYTSLDMMHFVPQTFKR